MPHLPPNHTLGTTTAIALTLPIYPAADGWAVSLAIRGDGSANVDAVATDTGWDLTLTPENLALLAPGQYGYSLRAKNNGQVALIEQGRIELRPDLFAQGPGYSDLSHAERVLVALEAMIEKKATKDQQRYVIEVNGSRRELWRLSFKELTDLRAYYRNEVARQRNRDRGQLGIKTFRVVLP